jgi:hypothetical protein
MAKLLKWWHQYSMFITVAGYIFLAGMTYKGQKDALAGNQETMASMQAQHDKENVDHRVTILEQIAADNRDNFSEIKQVQGKIFDRINQMADNK